MRDPIRQFKAEFFRALGHPARLKLLDAMRSGEKSVTELQAYVELEPAAVSQQLAVLRSKSIVATRKAGTMVFYEVRDPLVFDLLDVARRIFNNHLIDTQAMLAELSQEPVPTVKRKNNRAAKTGAR